MLQGRALSVEGSGVVGFRSKGLHSILGVTVYIAMIDSGLVGTAKAGDAQGTPNQSHTSPSILVHEEHPPLSIRHCLPQVQCIIFLRVVQQVPFKSAVLFMVCLLLSSVY